jgi:hypothetical protein
MPWTIRVPLLPDESIASWLARVALTQGCDPLSLTGSIWPKWRVWTIDIDRGIPSERLRILSELSGESAHALAAAGLRDVAETICNKPLNAKQVWPWILAIGSRNRRRHGGLQYCPVCLTSDATPYFRRHWRLAWHTTCSIHGTALRDRCHACGAPLEPHRLSAEDGHLASCARCKADLRDAPTGSFSLEAAAFQKAADETIQWRGGSFGGIQLSAGEWFNTARFLTRVVRQACGSGGSRLADALRLVGGSIYGEASPASGLPLELLAVEERASLLGAIHVLIKKGPLELDRALRMSGLSLRSIPAGQAIPNCIIDVFYPLPAPRTRPLGRRAKRDSAPKPHRVVMAAWTRLQRKILAEDL